MLLRAMQERLGLFGRLMLLPAFTRLVAGGLMHGPALRVMVGLGPMQAALHSSYTAALYRDAGNGFDQNVLEQAFRARSWSGSSAGMPWR